jgi:YesN/AraC family two-component response regulator
MDTLRVLIADDESLRVMSLKAQLEAIRHKVVAEASNGKEAVHLARELRPDRRFSTSRCRRWMASKPPR